MDEPIPLASSWRWEDIERLVAERTQEGPSLEFKRGAALSQQDRDKSELVKDASGLANAGGGTIVYGIAEGNDEGVMVAQDYETVRNAAITGDWISDVLKNNTQPPLRRFDINEVTAPERIGGRAIVLVVQAGETAHQSTRDHRYYQRGARSTNPMLDFQVRDVMGRRSAPVIEVQIRQYTLQQSAETHVYQLIPWLDNVGAISLERWQFELDLPRAHFHVLPAIEHGYRRVARKQVERGGLPFVRLLYPSQIVPDEMQCIYPDQELLLSTDIALPDVRLRVEAAGPNGLDGTSPSIYWRLFRPNAKPLDGEVSFENWCRF